MRKILILFLFLLCIQCSQNKTVLTEQERNFAITELDNSKNSLQQVLKGLSDTQLYFKNDKTSWSIAECVEHLTLFSSELFDILDESLELPSNPERRKDVKFSDDELIAFVQDRTNKNKTEEDFEPKSTYKNHAATINAYLENLEKHVNYLKSTKDDLRNHYVSFGTVDAYQIFLYMAAHTNRHIKQIKEIKNTINFPKN